MAIRAEYYVTCDGPKCGLFHGEAERGEDVLSSSREEAVEAALADGWVLVKDPLVEDYDETYCPECAKTEVLRPA